MTKLLILLLLILPLSVFACYSDYMPKPASFEFNSEGEAFGLLEDGSPFSQVNVAVDLGIRLQKFSWREGSWYVSDKGVIEADYDLQAFSIYLTL